MLNTKSITSLLTNDCLKIRQLFDSHNDFYHPCSYILSLKSSDNLSNEQKREILSCKDNQKHNIINFIKGLIIAGYYTQACSILWHHSCFDIRPKEAQQILNFIRKYDRVAIMGSGACGKTFNAAAFIYLDWWLDPMYTSVKVISMTAEHAHRNIFASIKRLHESCLLYNFDPSNECVVLARSIKIGKTDHSENGIHLLAIPKGDSGASTLRGYHPTPRGFEHEKFGALSRIRIILDEAEEIPPGVWQGVNNILSSSSEEDKGRIKVVSASNPKDRSSHFASICEPEDGWGSVDIDTSFEWKSKLSWDVLRIDAEKTDNIIQKKVIYPGMQTYDGYMRYAKNNSSAEYYTMARGWYPIDGVESAIISQDKMDKAKGKYMFIGSTIKCLSFDLALEGNDAVIMTAGRYGLATGWTNEQGEDIKFTEDKVCLQVDSIQELSKLTTLDQVYKIIQIAKMMGVKDRYICVDRTGNGAGVHDSLRNLYGRDVLGVNYSEMATDFILMAEDMKTAHEMYSGIVTELIFCYARLIEFDYIKFDKEIDIEILIKQSISRKYKHRMKDLVRVESKRDYCRRTNKKSPDELDSVSLLCHLFKVRNNIKSPVMIERSKKNLQFKEMNQSFNNHTEKKHFNIFDSYKYKKL